LMPADTWRGCRAFIGRMQTTTTAWPCDEEECYLTLLPLRGVYLISSSRGSLVICPSQRNSIYIAIGFLGKRCI
jgi:hypothetical protein